MNKGSIVERLCSDLDRKEPRYKSPTLLFFTFTILAVVIVDSVVIAKCVISVAQSSLNSSSLQLRWHGTADQKLRILAAGKSFRQTLPG